MPATEAPGETTAAKEYIRVAGSPFSSRVIAAAIILLFAYYAQGVVITLVLSILLAYCLDPLVEFLERWRIARTVGAMIIVLLMCAVLAAVSYSMWTRISDFSENWPKYSGVWRHAAESVEAKVFPGTPVGAGPAAPAASLSQRDSELVRNLAFRGIGSLYAIFLEVTFVPFLVFFMLAGKREVWHGTLQLFPASRRTQVKETLEDLRIVLRDYVLWMLVVTAMVVALSSLFFWVLGLDYPVLTGIVSGVLNMVPYIGAVLAWLPAFMLALTKWQTIGWFVLIAGVLTGIHIFALNLIAPQLVGRRLRLNAVAITVSLLFWGWVWGGMGLLLAIPITATLRVVCDHIDSLKPIGRWLSA
ncbi:MAG TPA: AI-2E family transporter [Candidatus Eisenbacteria bacterium]|nr:AI-2E family transporter [Candidatus Eisenbacteria bacterium]